MKKILMLCFFTVCSTVSWSQKPAEEDYAEKKIIVVDVPNGKIDLQKAKKQIVGRNKIKSGSEAIYQSGEEIVMTDGFVVEKGSEFVAEVVVFTEDEVAIATKEAEVFDKVIPSDLEVYPNPTTENLFLNLPNVSSGEIQMFGTSGQLVLKRDVSNEKNIQFSVRDLPVGVYILQVVTEKYQYTKKIIKN